MTAAPCFIKTQAYALHERIQRERDVTPWRVPIRRIIELTCLDGSKPRVFPRDNLIVLKFMDGSETSFSGDE